MVVELGKGANGNRPRRKRKPEDDPDLCSWCSVRARWVCSQCGQKVCEGHKANPYDTAHKPEHFDQPYRHCDGSCPQRMMKYLEPVHFEVCMDPRCAKVFAYCHHQVTMPETAERAEYLKSVCEWNEDGTVLTCTFCGVDGT